MSLKPFYAIALILTIIFWPKDKQRYIMSFDKKTRPITGCLKIGMDGYTAASIAMNCQRSIVQQVHLCSQGRLLKYFETEKECQAEYEFSIKTYGEYRLDADEFNNSPNPTTY